METYNRKEKRMRLLVQMRGSLVDRCGCAWKEFRVAARLGGQGPGGCWITETQDRNSGQKLELLFYMRWKEQMIYRHGSKHV